MQIFLQNCQTIFALTRIQKLILCPPCTACFLRAKHDDLEDATASILYGPLTQSKIERRWRELLDRMERFRWLKMVTDSTNKQDR